MNHNSSKLIGVVPTYNERQGIGDFIRAFFTAMPEASLLVVDDNSPDKTTEEVERLKKEFPNLDYLLRTKDRGFAKSYLDGFRKIVADNRYETVATMDADFSHNPKYIPAMFNNLSNFKVVTGSRYIKGGGSEGWGAKRVLLSRLASLYFRLILRLPVKDVTSGFFVFDKSVLNNINLNSFKSDGIAFMVEMKYKIFKNGHKISEYPVIVADRTQGQSKISQKLFKTIKEDLLLPWKLIW